MRKQNPLLLFIFYYLSASINRNNTNKLLIVLIAIRKIKITIVLKTVKFEMFAEIDQTIYEAMKQIINSIIAILKTFTIVLNVPIEKNNCKGLSACSGVLFTMFERIATIIVKDASIKPANETDAPIMFERISIFDSFLFNAKSMIEIFEFANHKITITTMSIMNAKLRYVSTKFLMFFI